MENLGVKPFACRFCGTAFRQVFLNLYLFCIIFYFCGRQASGQRQHEMNIHPQKHDA
jgi:hypothetical protein